MRTAENGGVTKGNDFLMQKFFVKLFFNAYRREWRRDKGE